MSAQPASRIMAPSRKKAKPGRSIREHYAPPALETIRSITTEQLLRGARSIAGQAQQLYLADIASQTPLWCVGHLGLIQQPSVAVIGTRNVSPEGALRARKVARELVRAGIVIVSGLAKGVDTLALSAAIEAGGRVIAVIGTPVDRVYPAENKSLQETIYREHLLISQFPPGARVFPGNFPERNRLMAMLSDATVIVQAGETSGTLHQAAECVRLGRWLFITKSAMEDPSLSWPSKFKGHPNVRTLAHTSDILSALGASEQ